MVAREPPCSDGPGGVRSARPAARRSGRACGSALSAAARAATPTTRNEPDRRAVCQSAHGDAVLCLMRAEPSAAPSARGVVALASDQPGRPRARPGQHDVEDSQREHDGSARAAPTPARPQHLVQPVRQRCAAGEVSNTRSPHRSTPSAKSRPSRAGHLARRWPGRAPGRRRDRTCRTLRSVQSAARGRCTGLNGTCNARAAGHVGARHRHALEPYRGGRRERTADRRASSPRGDRSSVDGTQPDAVEAVGAHREGLDHADGDARRNRRRRRDMGPCGDDAMRR